MKGKNRSRQTLGQYESLGLLETVHVTGVDVVRALLPWDALQLHPILVITDDVFVAVLGRVARKSLQ